jgi:hypothetical protein
MVEVKLPELPRPLLRFSVEVNSMGERLDYTAADMRAYALAAVQAERERCAKIALAERVDAKATGDASDAPTTSLASISPPRSAQALTHLKPSP